LSSEGSPRAPTPAEDDTDELKTLKGEISSFSDYQERAPTPVPSDGEIEEVAVDFFQAKIIRQAKRLSGRAGGLGTVLLKRRRPHRKTECGRLSLRKKQFN
jgi:hypothetical protein